MFWFNTLVLWIHLLAVMIWVGGILFHTIVVTPVLRKRLASSESFVQLTESIFQRFNRFSKELVGAIFLTGIFNLVNRGRWIQFDFSGAYLKWLALKIFLVLLMIGLQAYLGLALLPKWSAEFNRQKNDLSRPPGEESAKFHKQFNMIAGFMGILAGAIIFIALQLRYL